jgi:hypothetical protein
VVERHLRAFESGDFAAACDELSARAQRDVIAYVAESLPAPRPGSCDEAYGALQSIGSLDRARAGVMDVSRTDEESPPVEVVSVDGDEATARVGGSEKTVPLGRAGGDWKIARLDFSDVPGS